MESDRDPRELLQDALTAAIYAGRQLLGALEAVVTDPRARHHASVMFDDVGARARSWLQAIFVQPPHRTPDDPGIDTIEVR